MPQFAWQAKDAIEKNAGGEGKGGNSGGRGGEEKATSDKRGLDRIANR